MLHKNQKSEQAKVILHSHWKSFGENNVGFVEAKKRSIKEILELIMYSKDHYRQRSYWYDVLTQLEKL